MAEKQSIIPGVPVPYRLTVTGEIVGVPESVIPQVVLAGFTASLQVAAGVRSASVTVGTEPTKPQLHAGG